jgi:hypothetical protein
MIAFPVMTLMAQDKIYKTDNTLILGKVTKIANNSIEYKKFSNLNGPVYILPENEVNMILYENG